MYDVLCPNATEQGLHPNTGVQVPLEWKSLKVLLEARFFEPLVQRLKQHGIMWAKYYQVTDREQVPRGKGEKHPYKGNEIVPETVYLQAVGALWPSGNV